jgi:hypothetical protein
MDNRTLPVLSPLQRGIGVRDFCIISYCHLKVAGYHTTENTEIVNKMTSCLHKHTHKAEDFGIFCPHVEISITVKDKTPGGSDSRSILC